MKSLAISRHRIQLTPRGRLLFARRKSSRFRWLIQPATSCSQWEDPAAADSRAVLAGIRRATRPELQPQPRAASEMASLGGVVLTRNAWRWPVPRQRPGNWASAVPAL